HKAAASETGVPPGVSAVHPRDSAGTAARRRGGEAAAAAGAEDNEGWPYRGKRDEPVDSGIRRRFFAADCLYQLPEARDDCGKRIARGGGSVFRGRQRAPKRAEVAEGRGS